jgi:hypothetical protein
VGIFLFTIGWLSSYVHLKILSLNFFCLSSFVILNRLQILCALYMYVPLLYGNFSLMSLFLLSYRFFRMVGFGEEIQKANRSIARVSG